MKDGTELTHYGVKGMKWGKKLFGKVKGVFGKPTTPQQAAQEAAKRNAANATNYTFNVLANATGKRSNAQNANRWHQNGYRSWANSSSTSDSDRHVARQSIKRNSKRINGR